MDFSTTIYKQNKRLEFFLEPTVKITAVCDVTPCCVVDTYRRFGETAVGFYIREADGDNVKSFT